jgi:hypothetical protein
MSFDSDGGMILTGKTEELGEKLSQCHFIHHKSQIHPGANLGLCGVRPATNDLSHGTAETGVNVRINNAKGI